MMPTPSAVEAGEGKMKTEKLDFFLAFIEDLIVLNHCDVSPCSVCNVPAQLEPHHSFTVN